jgi:hypothetical protein
VNDYITFRCEHTDEDGNVVGTIQHKFQTEGYLPDMMYNFKSFLQGMGFNYVTEVYAVKNDNTEIGEE